MKSLSKKARKLLIVAAVLAFSAYIFFLSPSLLNLERNAEADSLNITNVVMQYVKRYYVDKAAVQPKAMLVEGLNTLEQIVDQVLVDFPGGEDGATFEVQVAGEKAAFDMSGVNDLDLVTSKLEQVFEFITPHLTGNDPKISDIEYAVLDRMLTSLDQHSGIITPQIYKEFMIETEGSFGGLGIVIGIRDGNLTVISPIEGTPADRIGIKPNDSIVQIENESTINMSLIEAVGTRRGQKGTEVSIHVMREGLSEPREYKIVRDTIVIESVETFDLENGIKYIRIRDFQKNTLDSILHSLNTSPETPGGIILDLRGNPGGLLDQAQRISDLFLTDGVIVTTQIGNSSKPYHANNKDEEFTGNVVVLVDAGSASASEIVAGALKNNERAVVIGERTFGKGSVQQIFDLNDGSALKLTIAQYLTPGDKSIQDVGVTPDIMLHPTIFTGESSVFHPDSDNRLNQQQKKDVKNKNEVFEKPVYNVSYLDEKKAPSEDDAEPIPEEALTKEERRKALDEDFYISLAKDIIKSPKVRSRTESLGEI
ncbi:MAG: PDZ domain-containing protein, partial [Candidatus Dadabacteria bacterium]|nr:PDZ domain-containing protein [Candidatus Dadabacteria bacterium]